MNAAQLPLHPARLRPLFSRAGPATAGLQSEQAASSSSELPPEFLGSRAGAQILASCPDPAPPFPGYHACQEDRENWINTWELLFAQVFTAFGFTFLHLISRLTQVL